ncbi:AI-2E family transporter [Schaalia odontolytica]|uniref:Pheromone autoinducer 2 transporter n=1 Tax=Schaalia odontolytica TaxID=1660 RepID=A0A2X0VNW0_9ACTO|nr:AI-2E family transporter [Schaalia odontolytica]WMS26975.1 AI-2E family transporter [Schaalia odontolytica]SPT55622.1 pheromone autoinducer 2 transporter [Schaalia odontolytica]
MADTQEQPRWKLSDLMGRLSAALPVKHVDEPAPAPVMVSVREEHQDDRDVAAAVPRSLRVAAAISWRALIVAGVVMAVLWGMARLTIVIMPVAIALTVAVLLEPLVSWMRRRLHFPSSLAATVGLLIFFAVVAGALSQAAAELIQQVPQLAAQAADGFRALIDAILHNEFLQDGPLKIDTTVLTAAADQLRSEMVSWLNTNKETLATGALNITSSVGTLATSGLTMLFCLFFFLKEGRSIWLWCVRLLPAPARVPVHESAIRGWATFGSYVRTQIQVAAIDAIGIALGAFFLGVPLAIPIGVITFFAAFVPILGALTSGVIAVLVAAVNGGLTKAIIMLVIILVVQQVESNILQPFMMSNAVSLHPVAVMLVITAGSAIAGIAGAIFSVPIAAFINATIMYLHGYDPLPELATAQDRPGGPPGILEEEIAASYAGKPDTRPYLSRVDSEEEEEPASADNDVEACVEADGDETREAVPVSEKEKSTETPTRPAES